MTFKWKKPFDVGGLSVLLYVVEARPVDGDWGNLTWLASEPDKESTVKGLEPGGTYQFRLMAQNETGLSQLSEITRCVDLKSKTSTSQLLFEYIRFIYHILLHYYEKK